MSPPEMLLQATSIRPRLWCLAITLASLIQTQTQAADYVGSESCRGCHEVQFELWRESHHYQAMLPANERTVLGDFSNVSFEYAGIKSRFFRNAGKFLVRTDDQRGELQDFEIAFTFGFRPIQQYLVQFPGGRMQALNIVWDSRDKDRGGQRWIHLYPDDPVTHEDSVHWTGSFQTWNSRCAACHSTRLEKNFSASGGVYQTTWAEINVGCEACHGPASDHLARLDSGDNNEAVTDRLGFGFSLADRGDWVPDRAESGHTLKRSDGKRPQTQVETCAGCHSRRSELTEEHNGKPFADVYELRLLEQGLYYPDGQILDEVYVYGSFLQSKMQAAGVVCSHCHDAHSNRVLARDNSLCTQCHDNDRFNHVSHHHHQQGNTGSFCVACHMPVKTYMVVDDRHDHSFRIPDPRFSAEFGTPNTCNQCHNDRDAHWAVSVLEEWGTPYRNRNNHSAVLVRARNVDQEVLPELLDLARNESKPVIIRATAALESRNFPSRETLEAARQLLASDDALIRAAAARSLDWIPPAQRYALLQALITDTAKSVRMEVARQLLGFTVNGLPARYATELDTLKREYLTSLELHADIPEGQLNLGIYYAAVGEPLQAEQAYRRAIRLSPSFVPAMLNLADLYRVNELDGKAGPLLRQAVDKAPGNAAAQHSLGLWLIRQKQLDEALAYLARSAERDPNNVRYGYVYGVALYEAGQPDQAIAVLETELDRHPGNPDLLSALAGYYQQLGQSEKLARMLEKHQP